MLEFFLENDRKLRDLRQCPVGEHLNGFANWLHAAGYKLRPGQLSLRGAAHLGHWTSAQGVPIVQINDEISEAFADHLPNCECSHAFQGRDLYNAAGARCFIDYLRTVGIIAATVVEPKPVPLLVKDFCQWMRQHRGQGKFVLTVRKARRLNFASCASSRRRGGCGSSICASFQRWNEQVSETI